MRLLSRYRPQKFWESRAEELIEVYDRPEDWPRRGWMREGAEETVIPQLLREAGVETVLVIGAGSGRQYGYLQDFDVSGVDISPTLVQECRRRYPHIQTRIADITTDRLPQADAVVSSGVLQHIPPSQIARTIEAIKTGRIVVIRESVRLAVASDYQFPHDYEALMAPWHKSYGQVTDERDIVTVELAAFVT